MTPHQEDKKYNEKMGKGPEQTLLQSGHTEGPETHERMLSVTSHQRCKLKQRDTTSHVSEWPT